MEKRANTVQKRASGYAKPDQEQREMEEATRPDVRLSTGMWLTWDRERGNYVPMRPGTTLELAVGDERFAVTSPYSFETANAPTINYAHAIAVSRYVLTLSGGLAASAIIITGVVAAVVAFWKLLFEGIIPALIAGAAPIFETLGMVIGTLIAAFIFIGVLYAVVRELIIKAKADAGNETPGVFTENETKGYGQPSNGGFTIVQTFVNGGAQEILNSL